MLQERSVQGGPKADLSIIRKSGRAWPCEITSVLFQENGIDLSIVSIVNQQGRLLKQKNIDKNNEKVVAGDIVVAQSKSDNRQAQDSAWMRSIEETSYDVVWTWDISSNQIFFGKGL